ncbi:MAG: alpha/beta hydrolase [Dehalococcoidia bacterium]|nr:alpha/beta hydrolase [Dehalococcoidia bacterium]MDW8119702.1 alpha/beta hydrolase [Chloroflexota bacterium]
MSDATFGLPLLEAARRAGVTIADPHRQPTDRWIDLRGLRFHYLDWGGEGLPVMLCLHGVAQNAHMWDFTALALCTRYRILALDQRGHGDTSWAPDGDYSLDAFVADLDAFVNALDLRDITLVGLSMGGRNAFVYAARYPQRVRTLVVADTGPEVNRAGTDRIGRFMASADVLDSFDAFVERTKRYNPLRPEWLIRGSLRHNLKQLPDGRWTWKYDPALRDPTQRIRRMAPSDTLWEAWRALRCPVLLVRGAESDVLAPHTAQEMAKALPHCQLVTIPQAGHLVPGDNPPAWEQALTAFLTQRDAPT